MSNNRPRKGSILRKEPIKEEWAIKAIKELNKSNLRDLALFVLGINSLYEGDLRGDCMTDDMNILVKQALEEILKRTRQPRFDGTEEVRYFSSYTNKNIVEARRLEKQGIRCVFPDPRGPSFWLRDEKHGK